MKSIRADPFIKKENMIQLLQLEEVLEWMEEKLCLIANSENLWDFEHEKSPIKKLSSFPP